MMRFNGDRTTVAPRSNHVDSTKVSIGHVPDQTGSTFGETATIESPKQDPIPFRCNSSLPDEKEDLKRKIESDLGSTFVENLDMLHVEESEEELSEILWESSVESSDGDVDPLLFYKDHFCEPNIEEERIFLQGELAERRALSSPPSEEHLADIAQSNNPMEETGTSIRSNIINSKPGLPQGSFSTLKPLQGRLEHHASETSTTTATTASSWDSTRFREYQSEQWAERFEELMEYAQTHGYCQVSHRDKEHDSLARWSKRQRYQYKLFLDGKQSTMTQDRIAALESLGFAFNAHEEVWFRRLSELKQYRLIHGHCNVPSSYPHNQKLSTWVKCQRRQHKLLVAGKRSNMTWARVEKLESLGFVWEIRPHGEIH
jgi:Helicase associated domain